MPGKYLRCPECGSIRLFLTHEDGSRTYFILDWDHNARTKGDPAGLAELNEETVFGCCGCSWTGRMKKLVKVFTD
ncbi:MAG: hypothetical protein ACYTGH_13285 [Planctomycetota bacterium]